jgi:Tol biopolymer transport system component
MEVRGPSPEFTADDSHIIFTAYGSDPERGMAPDVWQAPVPAGDPMLLVENASAASTSPSGRELAYAAVTANGTSIRTRSQDGQELEVAERGFWPRWSPTGQWIAYTTSDPEGGDGTVHVVRPDGSEHRELTSVSCQIYGLCWTHDGSQVIFASQQGGPMALWAVDVESGDMHVVTRGPGSCTSPTMASDGRRLVFDFAYHRWYLYLAQELGGPARRILVEPGMNAAALAPDGSRVAIALGATRQPSAVSVFDVRTSKRRTLSGMSASAVAWMPGGRRLLVAAPAPDEVSGWIWMMPADGGLPHPVMKGNENWDLPSPSPDGATIAAVRPSATGRELVLYDVETGNDRVLASKSSIDKPRWSPDGHYLAWSGNWRPDDVGSGGVWVCPVKGGSPRRLTPDGAWPVWEKDGESLLFARFLEHEGIWRVPLAGGTPRFVRGLEDVSAGFSLEGLDIGEAGTPLLFYLSKFTGELYVLEPPTD